MRCASRRLRFARGLLALALVALAAGCGRRAPAPDPAYLAAVEKWRAERLASLTAEDGWLTLVGLYWLRAGENRFGSDPADEVPITERGVPPVAGTLELRADGTVLLHPSPTSGLTVNGGPAVVRVLRSDRSGSPDVLALGPIRFYVIDRAGKLAVRVKDPHSPRRTGFKGLHYFPVDPGFRVVGTLEPYAAPRRVPVATVQGPEQTMFVPGLVRFQLHGRSLALEPFVSAPGDTDYFFVFRDQTSGRQTYGAGRFLDTAAPKGDSRSVVLDFNEAYTPPCAFTPFATCPLPLRQNELPVAVTAGEKFIGSH